MFNFYYLDNVAHAALQTNDLQDYRKIEENTGKPKLCFQLKA